MLRSLVVSVLALLLWITGECTCEKNSNTCNFYYWQVNWETAVKTCSSEGYKLLCYKSKKEMDDITEAFKLAAIGTAKLALWLSNRNCSNMNQPEKCLSLHIQKSGNTVWHYFQSNCEATYPFVCCVNGTAETTTSIEFVTSPFNLTSDIFDITDSSLSTVAQTSSSIRLPFCRGVSRRGVDWPDTEAGVTAVRSCPGNSAGKARWFCERVNSARWRKRGPDMTECRSFEVQNLKDNFNSSSASEVIDRLEYIFNNQDVFGEDLADVISLMTALPDRMFSEMESVTTSAAKWSFANDSVHKMVLVVDRMIELEDTWQDIGESGRSVAGTNLMSTVDGIGSLLADSLPENVKEQSIFKSNLDLQVLRPDPGQAVFLPQWSVTDAYTHQGSVMLKSGYDSQLLNYGNVSLVFALYKNMSVILSPSPDEKENKSSSSLNSAVVSASVTLKREIVKINSDVTILMEHLTPKPNSTACVFWNTDSDRWDTAGCRLESGNETHSVCICNHLTNFALLMDYRDVLSDVDQDAFHYITVIGCSISIVCLSICVVVFSCYSYHSRHSWGVRYAIHKNLCLTLLIANLILVCGMDKTENEKVCALIAGLLHYFFLSAFSWMLLEGVHIYLLLVVVFASRKSHNEKYYLFGYGFPLVIVIITYLSRPSYYGTDNVCWLSVEKGTIWGFMGPVAAILILNTAALILAQYKASKIKVKDDKVALIKRWLRVTVILFPVLGITWVFGFLYLGKHFVIAGYLFAVFNSFQGVCIFIFHCLLDKKARNMIVDSFKRKTTSLHTNSSGIQKKLKDQHQNGLKSNSITPVSNDDVSNSTKRENAFQYLKREKNKRDWSNWHKPWSFCFELPVSERNSREKNSRPQAVVVQWNSLEDKNCA